MLNNPVVTRDEWLVARKSLLAREKEETRLRDANREQRLALPWVKVEKSYLFQTVHGEKTLEQLFDGRSQLMVYHFMFGPDWKAGCPGCSFLADHLDGAIVHLNHHDVTLVCASRAPLDKIETYRKRMGWNFPWVSSYGSDFNYDFHVSFTQEQREAGPVSYNFREIDGAEANDELPGMSAFIRTDDGAIYHTYSNYARGGEELIGTLMILDRAPKGRNETGTMSFLKRHDEYETPVQPHACCD